MQARVRVGVWTQQGQTPDPIDSTVDSEAILGQ